MKKTTAALLLTFSFIILLGGISFTKEWLNTMNISTKSTCFFTKEQQSNPETRRVCLKGTCILYSEWIKLSNAEREALQQGS